MGSKIILAKENVSWIGTRFLDANTNTFLYNGQYYKAILPRAERLIKEPVYDSLLKALCQEKFIPETIESDLKIEGYGKIYSQYTEYFQAPLKYANPYLLKEAALLYIRMNLWLYKMGLLLIDGHCGNIVVQKLNEPYWCDIGSIKLIDNTNEYSGIEEFMRFFVYPLLLRRKCFSLGDMMRYSMGAGISHDMASALDLMTHSTALEGTREKIFQTLEGIVNNIDFIWEKTVWSDYGIQADLNTDIPDVVQGGHNRKALLMRLLKTLAPKTVIDLGANSGNNSRLAASLGAEVLALEPDETAVGRGHLYLREYGADKPIKFVVSEVFQMHQAADVAIALALTHHLFITNFYPWSFIAKTLADHTTKHLITEFMPNGLGVNQMQPNLPAAYNLESFVEQLKLHFTTVDILDYPMPKDASPRIMLLCKDKKSIT